MTRWARGGPANKKQPLPATSWEQMTDGATRKSKPDSDLHKTKKSKHDKKRVSTTKTDQRKSEARASGSALIAEGIEKIKRSEEGLGREDVKVLDEVVRKAERSEQRRVKRIRTKEDGKVGFV